MAAQKTSGSHKTAPKKSGPNAADTESGRGRVLSIATTGFTLMFAVWLMFGVLGISIRDEFGLTDVQFSWLTAVAILNGSIWRLPAGLAADRWGGRVVSTAMLLFTAIPAFLIAYATPVERTPEYATAAHSPAVRSKVAAPSIPRQATPQMNGVATAIERQARPSDVHERSSGLLIAV